MIADTSREAYEKAKEGLCEKQRRVFDFLVSNPGSSNQEIADALGWEINRVTGRVKELREVNLVLPAGRKLGRFGLAVHSWKANEWAHRFPSGRSMPKPQVKITVHQLNIPGLVNSWDR